MITPRTAQFAPYRAVLASRVRSQRSYRTNFALDLASLADLPTSLEFTPEASGSSVPAWPAFFAS